MFRKILVAGVALALMSCTPEQIVTMQQLDQTTFSPDQVSSLIALPDAPTRMGRTIIHIDGTTEELQCLPEAASEAHAYGDFTAPAQEFRAVTCERGWDPGTTEAWIPFIEDVIMKESGGCWNIRRGGRVGEPQGCVLSRQGRHSDSGYGQVIGIHWRGWLCAQEGLCSADDVVATPHSSMTALVALVERSGSHGWCWNAWARRFHRCGLAPDR